MNYDSAMLAAAQDHAATALDQRDEAQAALFGLLSSLQFGTDSPQFKKSYKIARELAAKIQDQIAQAQKPKNSANATSSTTETAEGSANTKKSGGGR